MNKRIVSIKFSENGLTEAPMDEVLSDNIYLYKRETNAVSAVFKESGMSKREMYLKKENVKKSKESVAI